MIHIFYMTDHICVRVKTSSVCPNPLTYVFNLASLAQVSLHCQPFVLLDAPCIYLDIPYLEIVKLFPLFLSHSPRVYPTIRSALFLGPWAPRRNLAPFKVSGANPWWRRVAAWSFWGKPYLMLTRTGYIEYLCLIMISNWRYYPRLSKYHK